MARGPLGTNKGKGKGQALGVNLSHNYYVPHYNYLAKNDMVYAECHVHKHKLLVGSILG
eukprot:SAG22_NODE_20187_length_267_cov_2.142857_1_plen_58_part_10